MLGSLVEGFQGETIDPYDAADIAMLLAAIVTSVVLGIFLLVVSVVYLLIKKAGVFEKTTPATTDRRFKTEVQEVVDEVSQSFLKQVEVLVKEKRR